MTDTAAPAPPAIDPPSPPPSPSPPSVHALAEQYAERHKTTSNYVLAWWTTARLRGRLGVAPGTWAAHAVSFALVVVLLLGAPLAVTAATGDWAVAHVRTWVVVAVAFGLLGIAIEGPFREAIDTFLSLHRVIVDPAGLRGLIAWDRRWFSVRASVPAAGVFATGMLAALYVLGRRLPGPRVPAGTVVVAAMLLYQVGEILYAVSMLGLESRMLDKYDYELYRLGPIDSIAVRRSIRGSNRIALLVGLVATCFILGFVLLLSTQTRLVAPLALAMLVVTYVATAIGVVMPRLAIRRIIQAEKERELAPLQARLDAYMARITELTEDEHKALTRLKTTHDAIRDSSENVLPIRNIGQLLSSVVLPTLTFAATTAGRAYITRLLERLRL
jgi:hypothetical protein